MRYFFLLFITIPILEMWVLIEVGARIGALSTVALVFLTAALGLALLRQQGTDTLFKLNQKVAQGQLPASEILSGVMLAVGGALLLTPGFITDAIGFACLLPITRKPLVALLIRKGVLMAMQGGGGVRFGASFEQSERFQERSPRREPPGSIDSGDVLDGEYRRED